MYKREKNWEDMIRVVKAYHPELVVKTYQAVGKSLADDRKVLHRLTCKEVNLKFFIEVFSVVLIV